MAGELPRDWVDEPFPDSWDEEPEPTGPPEPEPEAQEALAAQAEDDRILRAALGRPVVVVLGAAGFIGSVLTPMLLENGFRVRAIDRCHFRQSRLAEDFDLAFCRADTRALSDLAFEGADAVIDLAGLDLDDAEGELAEWAREIDVMARLRNVALAKRCGVTRYLLASSALYYGDQSPPTICREEFPLSPLGSIASFVGAAEREALAMADETFAPIAMRLSVVYGRSPRMRFDNPVNAMVLAAARHRIVPLRRSGRQWRPFLDVKDAASAAQFLLGAPRDRVAGQAFNIGSDHDSFKIGPLAQLIASLAPRACELRWYGEIDRFSCRVSFDKIEALGWRARYSVKQAAREMFSRYRMGDLKVEANADNRRWYESMVSWGRVLRSIEMTERTLDIGGVEPLPPPFEAVAAPVG